SFTPAARFASISSTILASLILKPENIHIRFGLLSDWFLWIRRKSSGMPVRKCRRLFSISEYFPKSFRRDKIQNLLIPDVPFIYIATSPEGAQFNGNPHRGLLNSDKSIKP